MKRYGAEFFGTFWLVLGNCGSAVLAAAFPNVGIDLLEGSQALRFADYTTFAPRSTSNSLRTERWHWDSSSQ